MINRQSLILKKSYLCICMKQFLYSRSRIIESLIHIIGWGIVFAFPFVMMTRGGFDITLVEYLRHGSIVPLSFLIVFYTNYCFLIPRYLFEGRIKQYLLLNIVLIVCITAGVHFWQEYAFHTYTKGGNEGRSHMGPPKWIFIMRDLFSMILTVGLSAAIRLSGRWVQVEAARREAEKSRTEAELKNLRNQLNPHFLCNTLDTMKWISKINQVPQVALMSTDLADILRFCISPDEFVPLRREVEILRRYMEIQSIRLSGKCRLEVDMPPELEECRVPKMILQPLAENAILHGLDGVEDGVIWVRVRSQGTQTLTISVEDNGRGLPPELMGPYTGPPETSGRGHLGLYNVDTILKKHYGEAYGLRLGSRPGGPGAAVTASLPLWKEEEIC